MEQQALAKLDRQSLPKGALVRNQAGRKLGIVVTYGEGTFVVGAGMSASPEYTVRYTDVAEIRDGDIILEYGLEELRRRNEAEGPTFPSRRTEQARVLTRG